MQLQKSLQKQIERVKQVEKNLSSAKGGNVVFELTSNPAKALEAWLRNDENFNNVSPDFKEQVDAVKARSIYLLNENAGVRVSDLLNSLKKFRENISAEIKRLENASRKRSGSKSSNGGPRRVRHHRNIA
ncbi:MAG: hypothetical protein N4A44_01480 [Alphaproteobacteria bacterium]|jgi:DNA mismatch repair ATPase MutS|nr:hypothetical protein [Alphaproteobacteria bacterium]